MKGFNGAISALAAICFLTLTSVQARADVTYAITVNTSSLSAGDYIDLQFNPANAPLSATALAFNYSGPNLDVTSITTQGNATGNLQLPEGLSLMNGTQYNDYNEAILTPTGMTTFDVTLSGPEIDSPSGNNGATTFALSFFASDDATPLLDDESNDPNGDVFEITINNDGTTSTLTNSSFVTVAAAPEPSYGYLVASVIGAFGLLRKRKNAAGAAKRMAA